MGRGGKGSTQNPAETSPQTLLRLGVWGQRHQPRGLGQSLNGVWGGAQAGFWAEPQPLAPPGYRAVTEIPKEARSEDEEAGWH